MKPEDKREEYKPAIRRTVVVKTSQRTNTVWD